MAGMSLNGFLKSFASSGGSVFWLIPRYTQKRRETKKAKVIGIHTNLSRDILRTPTIIIMRKNMTPHAAMIPRANARERC